MKKTILHVDCNKFYASVECLHRPEIRNLPVAVGGSEETRHGIILTKNEIASKYGLTVGEPLWRARQKCPDLVIVPPNYPLYVRFSRLVRNILSDYSDYIEPFGLDESWMDVTGSRSGGLHIAEEIGERVKFELGITVSVGVSFNKVFAKLGSDYKKPDAVTVITKNNYQDIVWPLPCSDLLFIGKATEKKLHSYGIYTIGELACADIGLIRGILGKNGEMLHSFANGLDLSPVRHISEAEAVKSVSNSTTTPRDLVNNEEVKMVFTVLAESVSRRLREQGLRGRTVTVSIRDKTLFSFTRQAQMKGYSNLSSEIIALSMKLFLENYFWKQPVRSLGVAVSDFDYEGIEQFDLSGSVEKREKLLRLETAVDGVKRRFGNFALQRASQLKDPVLSGFNPHDDHTVHPVNWHC